MAQSDATRDPSRGKFELDNVIKEFGQAMWGAAKEDFGEVCSDVSQKWNDNVVKPVQENIEKAGNWCKDRLDDLSDVKHGVLGAFETIGRGLGNAWKNFSTDVTEGYQRGVEENRSRRNGISTPVVETPEAGGPEFC